MRITDWSREWRGPEATTAPLDRWGDTIFTNLQKCYRGKISFRFFFFFWKQVVKIHHPGSSAEFADVTEELSRTKNILLAWPVEHDLSSSGGLISLECHRFPPLHQTVMTRAAWAAGFRGRLSQRAGLFLFHLRCSILERRATQSGLAG